MAHRKKKWSYNAGERGRNWVRAYCKGCERPCSRATNHPNGTLYLEWFENHGTDSDLLPRQVRRSALLRGVTAPAEAKQRADELAARFAAMPKRSTSEREIMSIGELLQLYVQTATPKKGESKQDHDRRCARLWRAYFEDQTERDRSFCRPAASLDRRDWERFIDCRANGRIPGWPRMVRNKIIRDDLAFLVAALNWGVGARFIDVNPWGGTVRRAQGWKQVQEMNPHRPGMPAAVRGALVRHSTSWQFVAALRLERETRRRNKAIRNLMWSDVDLDAKTITWRSETDKRGRRNTTPISREAYLVLKSLPSRGIGDAPVFPSGTDPSRPSSRHAFQQWLKRAKAALLKAAPEPERESLRKQLRGVGFHSEKRSGVRDPDFRGLPAAIQEEIAGTNFETLRRIYDEVTVEDIREAWPEAMEVCG
jgi:hypothetical protein